MKQREGHHIYHCCLALRLKLNGYFTQKLFLKTFCICCGTQRSFEELVAVNEWA